MKGFESSETRSLLIETLSCCGFSYEEFLLSPNQLNIPNSRLRYYLIAKHNQTFNFDTNGEILLNVPQIKSENLCSFCTKNLFDFNNSNLKPIKEYIEDLDENDLKSYLLPDKVLIKYYMILDIVREDSVKTNCFTKGYSHHIEGAGSVLQCSQIDLNFIYDKVLKAETDEEKLSLLKQLNLRYFTPKEIANLMCFPSDFCEYSFFKCILFCYMFLEINNNKFRSNTLFVILHFIELRVIYS